MLQNLKSSIIKNSLSNSFFINNTYFTYYDLNKKIISLQTQLKSQKINSKNIGLVTNNDLETYASILAIWFSGFSYIPLSPRTPKDRNSNIISQADIQVIISSSDDMAKFIHCENITIVNSKTQISINEEIEIAKTSADDLFYTLFTSGSTGIPKGVPIDRKNIETFVESFFSLGFKIDETDHYLQMFELTFDVSVACFLIPLLVGACVYTVPSDEVKYTYIYRLLEKQRITIATIVPSILAYLKPYFNEIKLPSLKYCILTAEASSHKILSEWTNCLPNAEIWNLYGPTEATIWCLEYKWVNSNESNKQYNGLIPIGKPLKNVDAIIIDENNQVVDKEIKGELCVAGNQVTPGYLNNETKNKKSFFIKDKKRYYKTGDMCFKNAVGDIMYCGRIDNQVQIQGFRVELGEIEHHVRSYTKITNIAAIAFENEFGNTEIHLFIENYDLNPKQISEYLKTKIPPYMLPTAITSLSAFPVNASNKIDRISLKKLIENKHD